MTKNKWEVVYYLGVDGVMHPTKRLKLRKKKLVVVGGFGASLQRRVYRKKKETKQ